MPANLCKLMVRHWAWFPLPFYTVLGDEKHPKRFAMIVLHIQKALQTKSPRSPKRRKAQEVLTDEKPKKSLQTKSPRSPYRRKAQEVLKDEKPKKA